MHRNVAQNYQDLDWLLIPILVNINKRLTCLDFSVLGLILPNELGRTFSPPEAATGS